mgnify:CR=1 FL=1
MTVFFATITKLNQILYTNIMKKTTLLTLSLLMIIGITSAQQPQYEKAPNRYGWNELFLWGSGYTYESLYGDVQCSHSAWSNYGGSCALFP